MFFRFWFWVLLSMRVAAPLRCPPA